MVVGAVAAALVGMPALRLRGLYLAVTTFAFALATTSFLLNDDCFGWVPTERVERAPLLGGFEVESEAAVYYLVLGRARVGRPGPARRADQPLRPGPRGGARQRAGRRVVRRRPGAASASVAFALSGAIAALAGGLFIHHERAFDPSSYSPVENLVVLTMVVVGGMTSVAGAVLGALFLLGRALVPRPRVAVPRLGHRRAR